VTHTTHLFGAPVEIARKIKQWIWEHCRFTCSIGIGPNKLVAKFASSRQKPNGLVVIQPAEVPRIWERLPVTALCGIGEKLKERLARLGISILGELAQADPRALFRAFGVVGPCLKQMALGQVDDPVRPYFAEEKAKSIGHLHTLDVDTDDPALLRATLLALSEKVGRRARLASAQGQCITLTVRLSDFTTLHRQKRMAHWVDDGYEIYQCGLKILKRVMREEMGRQKIRLLGIGLCDLVYSRQLSFLKEDERRDALIHSMDAINDQFGEWTVLRSSLLAHAIHRRHYQIRR
jgi:DNA polymerase-4